MRILFATAELAPLCQSGGLGEAVSGLARALSSRGHEVICAVPGYRVALEHPLCPPLDVAGDVKVHLPFGTLPFRLRHAGSLDPSRGDSPSLIFLDAPELFDRPGLYGDGGGLYADQGLRFIAFSRAVAYLAEILRPDVLVAHDWHAALALCVLRTALHRGKNREIGAVQVVHNNAYQGVFSPETFPLTGLPQELFHPDGLEAWGSLNLLKAGILFADRIVCVSPSYAEEVKTPAFGEGLEGAYRERAHRLCGIANGIDTERYDPAADLALPARFSAVEPRGKARCRAALLDELGLDAPPPGLLLGAVGRFAAQKGWDVLAHSLPHLIELGASVALLGDGDPAIAKELEEDARSAERRVALRIGFDDGLARRIYAGVDAVLVPSRFEPCGLVQQIAQRYGAVPVAHAVGGLKDTLVCARREGHVDWESSTGVLFSPLTGDHLAEAVREVARLGESAALEAVQRRLLALDRSWATAAEAYEEVFQAVREEARTRR